MTDMTWLAYAFLIAFGSASVSLVIAEWLGWNSTAVVEQHPPIAEEAEDQCRDLKP